jgi:hypothetical protein
MTTIPGTARSLAKLLWLPHHNHELFGWFLAWVLIVGITAGVVYAYSQPAAAWIVLVAAATVAVGTAIDRLRIRRRTSRGCPAGPSH